MSRLFYESAFFPFSVFNVAITAHLLGVMTKTVNSAFIAYEKNYFDLITTIISSFLIIILVSSIVFFDMTGVFFFYAFALANLMGFIVSIIIKQKFISPIWIINFRLIAYLIKQSFPIAITTFMTQGYNNIFVFFLKLLRDTAEVSLFQAPQRIIQQCHMIPRALLLAYAPTLSRLARDGQSFVALQNATCMILKYIFIFTLPVSLFITTFADQFILLAFGPDFFKAAVPLQILVWAINLLFVNILLDFILTSMRKQNLLTISNGLCLAVSSSIGFVLVFKCGYLGACWATLLSFVVLAVCNFYFVSKHLGLIPVHRIVIKPVLCCMVLGAILFEYSDKINIIIVIVLSLTIYTGLLFLFRTFTCEELNFLRHGITVKLKGPLELLVHFINKKINAYKNI